jgi:hypothetical protein
MSDDQTTRTTDGRIITQEGIIPSSDFNFTSPLDCMEVNILNTGGLPYPDRMAIWSTMYVILPGGDHVQEWS